MRPTPGPFELDRRNRIVQASSGGVVAECPHRPDAQKVLDLLQRDHLGSSPEASERIDTLERQVQTLAQQLDASRREISRLETSYADKPLPAQAAEMQELQMEITRLRAEIKKSKKP